ncbi:MAG: hypothetical protein JW715_03980 [Sedimentisphaerales bacterium]|nr:hypothetical protein [Sedimentisphaerales bacterium]
MQKHLFIKYLIFAALFPVVVFGQNDVPKQTVKMELFENSDMPHITGYGNCQWLHPLDEPGETLLEQPDYKSDKLYYYAAKYGDAEDNIYTIVLDESQGTGKGYDTVYVDADNDNRIDPDAEKFSLTMSTTRNDIPLRMKLMVSAGGKKIPYYFNFTAFPYTDENNPVEKIHANARNSSIFTGQAYLNGKKYKIGIADLNSNGLFNDVEQGLFKGDRFLVDFNNDGLFQDPLDVRQESFSYGRYTKIAENWFTIEADPSGTSIEISPASPDIVKVQAPKNVSTMDLHSAVQSQRLSFSDCKAEAVTGDYRLAAMKLSMPDSQSRIWTANGSFRENQPEISLKMGEEKVLPEMLPFTVSIEPSGKAPFEEVTFTLKITTSIGGTFRTPRAKQRPDGGFEIHDAEGKIIASETFKYG